MLRLGVFLLVFLFAGVAFAQPAGEGARGWEQLSPAQRAEVWGRMSPEQRDRAWRRLPPDERSAIRERMSPQEREQMRHRFLERRPPGMAPEGRADPRALGTMQGRPGGMGGPGASPGPEAPRRLSPDERRQLREQVREANRELPPRPRHEGRGR